MRLLHIDSSILGSASASRVLTAAAVEHFRNLLGTLEVVYRDLAAEPLGHLGVPDMPHYDGHRAFAPDGAKDVEERAAASTQVLDEFLAADLVVIGAPMYNLTVPTQLKAWLDRLVVPGRTIGRGEGALASGKRVVAICTYGGSWGPDSPRAGFEMCASLLRNSFQLMGIELESIVAEGTQKGPESRARGMANAIAGIARLR